MLASIKQTDAEVLAIQHFARKPGRLSKRERKATVALSTFR